MRQALFARIAKLGKRKDMQGIASLDILGTTILLRHATHLCHDQLDINHLQKYLQTTLPLPAFETGALEAVIAGATRTGTRLHAANMIDDPSCKACGHHEETIDHMFWECPATEHLRPSNILELRQTKTQQPRMWATCGLMRRQHPNEQLQHTLHNMPPYIPPPPPHRNWNRPRITVYTDGGCQHQSDPTARYCGAGIYVHPGHPMNTFICVPGMEQSNQRAELLAVVHAISTTAQPTTIASDSKRRRWLDKPLYQQSTMEN